MEVSDESVLLAEILDLWIRMVTIVNYFNNINTVDLQNLGMMKQSYGVTKTRFTTTRRRRPNLQYVEHKHKKNIGLLSS